MMPGNNAAALSSNAVCDEMFGADGQCRQHYQALYRRLHDMPASELRRRQQAADLSFLHQGITDSTMNHGEGWHFIQVGRFIERASATATLLDVHFNEFADAKGQSTGPRQYLDWVGLLKSCTAFEAYCKVYTAELRPDRIAEFLLLNAECPRSVRFAADRVQTAFQAIAEATGTRKAGRVNRLAGRLRAALNFGQIDEIIEGGLHDYLSNIQRQCAQIHTAIQQTYVAYSIESALVS
jgi:uncharacterized alpha-E superfamily protein